MQSNPFGTSVMGSKPFDSNGTGIAPPQGPFSEPSSYAANPFQQPPAAPQFSDNASVHSASSHPSQYAQPPYAAAPHQQQYNQAYYGAPSPPTQAVQQPPQFTGAMVPSQQQANPYAMSPVTYQQPDQYAQQQAIVPAQQQSNPYALSGNPFDPYLAKPPPPADPFVEHQPAFPTAQPPATQQVDDNPFGPFEAPKPAPVEVRSHSEPQAYKREEEEEDHPRQQQVTSSAVDSPQAKYRAELARQAPPGSAPLPRAEMVLKKGFVLSRISFRTIVMKKWKQSFWVQYGPHTMLWFRSESDFEDWLNNPYHDQTQRNFLIKLAVNFVHDLYKPNVRGYQVTQCRTKAYGNKMVRQFKLERWMDYGPTIAAAFGSYDPKEVDALREALIECMRNTPLNNGIRATGAVRQENTDENREQGESEGSDQGDQNYARNDGNSAAEEADLLDVSNWDDVHSTQHDQPSVTSAPAAYGSPGAPAYGYAQPSPYGQHYTQPYQQQGEQPMYTHPQQPYEAHNSAIVPAVPQNQAYPGAPPPPQPVQQQYQDPWASGASQQSPYGQPQQYAHQQSPYQQQPTGY